MNAEVQDALVAFVARYVPTINQLHNSRRHLKTGGDSFTPIIENIDSVNDILPISIRINVDKTNAPEIGGLFDFFYKQKSWGGNNNFHVYFDQVKGVDGYDESCYTLEEVAGLSEQYYDKLGDYLDSAKRPA